LNVYFCLYILYGKCVFAYFHTLIYELYISDKARSSEKYLREVLGTNKYLLYLCINKIKKDGHNDINTEGDYTEEFRITRATF
jgi:hypothetical protein